MLEALATQPGLAAGLAGLFGLLVGSFLNVVILRLPPRLMYGWRAQAREVLELPVAENPAPPDLVYRASHCPRCGAELRWSDNIPLLSYALLRGRCRACAAPISLQYPLVELATGVLSAVAVWRFGVGLHTLVILVAVWMLIAATVIDLRTQLLPDELTLSLLWLGLLHSIAPGGLAPSQALLGAAFGYGVLWSVYWLFKLATGKEGMGFGDFKLLAALGAFVGPSGIVPILLLSSVIGAVVGATWLKVRGADRSTPIPFGPFLAAAGWVWIHFGEAILTRYLAYAAP